MEDMRNNRSISAVSLASQYRLSQRPKRPEMKKVTRKKKTIEVEEDVTVNTKRLLSDAGSFPWLLNNDDDEFDFDAEEDAFFDAIPDDGTAPYQIYTQACARLNTRPVKCIYDALKKQLDRVPCKSLVLKRNDVQACTIALVGAVCVEALDFEGNFMGGEGGVYFGDVLNKNTFLTDIRIAYNNLGSAEAKSICNALLKNMKVKKLDLSGNRFNEQDAIYFKELLEENSALRILYIGHNYFREEGGEQIAEGLANNDFLEVLDLSWNHLRLKGAAAIGEALMKNNGLLDLDISWNGFHSQGSTTLSKALEVNHCLVSLNLACNRLSEPCVAQLFNGLKHNTTLKNLRFFGAFFASKGCPLFRGNMKKSFCLKPQGLEPETTRPRALIAASRLLPIVSKLLPWDKNDHPRFQLSTDTYMQALNKTQIGKNCISPKGATSILEYIKKYPDMGLEYIDMADQTVEECFLTVFEEINAIRPLKIDHGGVWSNERDPIGKQDVSDDEMALLNENPLYILVELMKVMEFRLVDLFHVLDKDHSRSISTTEFKEGLEAVRIPLKKKSLERFVKMLDTDKSGEIEYSELSEANRQYKEKLKQYVRDKVPIENTDIGRIARLVRKIIKENELMHADTYNADSNKAVP